MRLGFKIWVAFAFVFVGCAAKVPAGPLGPSNNEDGGVPVYEECTTVCLRPGDCALAYSSGDVCPPGFHCASRFSCTPDGGQ